MPEHLSVEQITKYGQGKLAPDEWPPVVAHLNECSTCFAVLRDLFPQRTNPQRHVLLSLRTPEEDDHWHLDFDAHLRPFVDGEADEVEREVIESHLSVCADCGQAMRELREFKDSLRLRQLERELDKEHAQQSQTPLATDSRHKLALWWRRLTAPASSLRVALSVSLLVLLCAGGLLWFKSRSSVPSQNIGTTQSTLNGDETISPAQPGQSQPGDLQARAPSNSSSPAVAQSTAPGTQIQDGTTQIILDQHGNLKGLESLPLAFASF
jgi:predicted anti-sigma-YlaC factor YlaD